MTNIVRPTSSSVVDAIAKDSEHTQLLQAMAAGGMSLSPSAVAQVTRRFGDCLMQMFPGCDQGKALAIVVTAAANQAADIVAQIERSHPISDAGRDGRVTAVTTFFERLIKRAVDERAMAAKMDANAAKTLSRLSLGARRH